MVMPQLDGHETTKQLRQLPMFQKTAIVMVSASAFNQDRNLSIEVGCNDFIAKPVDPDALFYTMRSLLNLEWQYEDAHTHDPNVIDVANDKAEAIAQRHRLRPRGSRRRSRSNRSTPRRPPPARRALRGRGSRQSAPTRSRGSRRATRSAECWAR